MLSSKLLQLRFRPQNEKGDAKIDLITPKNRIGED